MVDNLNKHEVQAFFTGANGAFRFARWGRPVAPMVIGVDDQTLATVKGAFEALATLIDQPLLTETDAELGSNCIFFFVQNWEELRSVPDLGRLFPNLDDLLDRLQIAKANQYRTFRFDAGGSIKAAFVFLRMDRVFRQIPAEDVALSQVTQMILCWSDVAFAQQSPLARAGDVTVLRPDIAKLIRVAYDPVLPPASQDPSFVLRLMARLEACA